MILDYISPAKVYRRLTENFIELSRYMKFKNIITELNVAGKLDEIGIKTDSSSNMYIGINLNPELLLYSEMSQESVELKLISEKMNKYNDFLTKEGILDVIKVDYERVQDDNYYGYVLQLSFNFKKYRRSDFIYDISYYSILLIGTASLILSLF